MRRGTGVDDDHGARVLRPVLGDAMTIERIVQGLHDLGGEANIKDLEERIAYAKRAIRRLIHQGYLEKVSDGRVRFTKQGERLRPAQ